MTVQPIPEGHEGIIPHLVVVGAADALDFYARAFGAEEIRRAPAPPDGQRLMHAEIRIGGRPIFLADDFPEWTGAPRCPKALGATSVTIHQCVLDVDAAVARAVEAGATLKMPVADMFWGDRYGIVTCPFGHDWSFSTHIADPTPEEVEAAAAAAFGGDGPC
jgi:uncharacterized glyoxalase superfamily protein PhnB